MDVLSTWHRLCGEKCRSLGCGLYTTKTATFNFCRRLIALLFLPAEYIPAQFEAKEAAGPPPTFGRLVVYYRTQKIVCRGACSTVKYAPTTIMREGITDSTIWWPTSHPSICTNWSICYMSRHEMSTSKCHPWAMAHYFDISEKIQKKVQAMITDCWQQLTEGNMSGKEVLKRCAQVNGPI